MKLNIKSWTLLISALFLTLSCSRQAENGTSLTLSLPQHFKTMGTTSSQVTFVAIAVTGQPTWTGKAWDHCSVAPFKCQTGSLPPPPANHAFLNLTNGTVT